MPPRIVSLFYFLCAIGLGLYVWGLAGQKHLARVPAGFEFSALRYPVLFNGIEAADSAQIRFLAQGYPVGTLATIRRPPGAGEAVREQRPGDPAVAREPTGGEVRVTLAPTFGFEHWLLVVIEGALFWLVAAFIFAPRSQDPAARDFFACTGLYGLAVTIGGVYFTGSSVGPEVILVFLQMVCLAFLPPFFLHLTLIFPRRSPWLDRVPRLPAITFGLAAFVVVWQMATHWHWFTHPGPASFHHLDLPLRLGDLLMVVEAVAACAFLFQSGIHAELERQKQQARWLLAGFFVGITPYVFLRTLPSLWKIEPPFGSEFDRLFELAIPAAFVLAVVRHKLLDIDVIIRRGTIYAFMAAAFVGFYLLFALSLGRAFSRRYPQGEMIIDVLVALVAVALFNKARTLIGGWVDRTFFKIRYDHSRALRALRRRLERIGNEQELARVLVEFVESTLQPRLALAVIADQPEPAVSGSDGALDPERVLNVSRTMAGKSRHAFAAPRETSLPERERPEYPQEFLGHGFRVVQPVCAGERFFGALLLGEKNSERRYVELDLRLLESAGRMAGRALDRLTLMQVAAREAYEKNRLNELNRLKDEFLTQVAHDLRTPLTSIVWTADNLADGIAGPMNEQQTEYTRAMRISAGQLGRLIGNLMNSSRLDTAGDRPGVGPVDMTSVIDEAVVSLKPLAGSRQIELRPSIAFPAGTPCRIAGNADRLLEVLNNLIDNAIRFSPDGSVVEITLVPDSPGWCRLSVRDRGPGLDKADLDRVFSRYIQGRPSPHASSKGLGLGLHVVKSYVEQFGGSVSAANHPDGGAEFTCRLKEWQGAAKEAV